MASGYHSPTLSFIFSSHPWQSAHIFFGKIRNRASGHKLQNAISGPQKEVEHEYVIGLCIRAMGQAIEWCLGDCHYDFGKSFLRGEALIQEFGEEADTIRSLDKLDTLRKYNGYHAPSAKNTRKHGYSRIPGGW